MTPHLYIAAGHGGIDKGNTTSGKIERDELVRIVAVMRQWFKVQGITGATFLDDELDLAGEVAVLNKYGLKEPDLAIDIHLDYKANNSGALVLYDESAIGKRFAEVFLPRWCNETGIKNNGVFNSKAVAKSWRGWDDFGFCRPRWPGVIVELGCINSTKDMLIVRSDAVRNLLAQIVWETWQSVTGMQAHAKGLTVQHAPRISRMKFGAVLRDFQSPAAALSDELYDICLKHGIDPAVALAFFAKESTFGKFGKAVANKSWGNVRTPFDPELSIPSDNGFARYLSWSDSLEDWCKRINQRYVKERGLSTVETIVPVYAPDDDGNDVQGYITFVRDHVRDWSASVSEPNYPGLWGPHYAFFADSGIAQAWKPHAETLRAATSDETTDKAGRVWRLFEGGAVGFKDGKADVYLPRVK